MVSSVTKAQDQLCRLRLGFQIDSMATREGVTKSDLIWLSEAQMHRIESYFTLSHGGAAS